MENNIWVKNYIDDLISSDKTKEAIRLREKKIPYADIPLYKYNSILENDKRNNETIDYTIDNFENDKLFFQDPIKFNDPFDCYLGFSQIQVIKDIVIQELRTQKVYNKEMRKAINIFFSDELISNININEQLSDSEFKQLLTSILELAKVSYGEDAEIIKNIFLSVFLKDDGTKELFNKLMKKNLTVRDNEKIIDLLFENEDFIKKIRPESSDGDIIVQIVKDDMKLKVEKDVNGFLEYNGGEIVSIFDLFNLLLSVSMPGKEIKELNIIKDAFNKATKEALSVSRELISNQFRITCLSERMDSPLMWSHYANKHFGFCIQYDFTYSLPFIYRKYPDLMIAQLMIFPVNYSNKRPLLSQSLFDNKTKYNYFKTKKLPPNLINNIMLGLLHKSSDWDYEQEWRIIKFTDDEPFMKIPPPRKVYLGANMESPARDRIISIARSKGVPVFQMFLKTDKFEFDYFQVSE